MLKPAFRYFAKHPGHQGYAFSAPLLKALCKTRWGRKGVEILMRAGGRALFWAFEGKRQEDPEKIRLEWERILQGIGLQPNTLEDGRNAACATCFHQCTLNLTTGDDKTCDTVMSINDELIDRIGGKMSIEERLTDPNGSRCVVRIHSAPQKNLPGERALWCDPLSAQQHFDKASHFYDFIMGYFEIPTNIRAVRHLALKEGDRVLDLGTGTGLSLLQILKSLPSGKVVSIDTSKKMLDRSRRRIEKWGYLERAELRQTDAADTQLPSSSIDAIYSSFLLDLLDVQKRVTILQEMKRILKPEGVGVIAVMNGAPRRFRDKVLTTLYNAGYARWNPIWKTLFRGYAPHCRPIRLRELLESEGFEVVSEDRSYVLCFPVAIYVIRAVQKKEES